LLVSLALVSLAGCVNGYYVNRDLHYVVEDDGSERLVRTPSPPPAAYEAYLRARLALERTPADLDGAREQVFVALRWHPGEPQLWVLLAEIEWRAGQLDAAEAALEQAQALRPGFAPVEELRGRMAEASEPSASQ